MALKVNTDAILLGAWVRLQEPTNVLDVGTGLGTIALMLAQRYTSAQIRGIDINKDVLAVAKENCRMSPFVERLSMDEVNFLAMDEKEGKMEHIVSNPPFYKQSTKSATIQKTQARHEETLPVAKLISKSFTMLHPNGSLSLIMPYERMEEIIGYGKEATFHLSRVCTIIPKPKQPANRVMLTFSKARTALEEQSLVLRDAQNNYSSAYWELVEEFLPGNIAT